MYRCPVLGLTNFIVLSENPPTNLMTDLFCQKETRSNVLETGTGATT